MSTSDATYSVTSLANERQIVNNFSMFDSPEKLGVIRDLLTRTKQNSFDA